MTAAKKKLSITEGPLFFRMILFALPIMATGILQILYNMADNIVVGRFSGDEFALGAVGSTSSLTNLVVNLLLGIGAGTSVVIAHAFGARQEKVVSRTVHTALTFSLVGGIAFGIIGYAVSRPALELMGTAPAFIDGAVLYFRIICLGIPASAVYNFGAAILRSVGDSKTPLIILASTGLVNVGLNFLFILCFNMTVDGVATATIVSQYLSAISVVAVLFHRRYECYGFSPSKMCFDLALLKKILRYGIPSGIQSSLFSISNILLTSSINTLSKLPAYGEHIVTAYTVSGNIDAITFTSCNSFHHAAMTFTGQNFGAGKMDRVKRVIIFSLVQVTLMGILVAQTELLFGRQIASLYIDPSLSEAVKLEITDRAMEIMVLLLNTYFLCGIMDVLSGLVKGLGYALIPMTISLVGIYGLRVIWVFAVFPSLMTPVGLMLCYPISWSLSAIALAVLLIIALARLKKQKAAEKEKKENVEAA